MSNTISVGCRMPGGLRLHIDESREVPENILGGGTRMVKRWFKKNQPDVVLRGFSLPRNGGVESFSPDVIGGVGITHGVDADFFAEWLSQNADSDLVKNKIVFSATKSENTKDAAREMKGEKMGLEPLDPSTTFKDGEQVQMDTRWPKKITAGTNKQV